MSSRTKKRGPVDEVAIAAVGTALAFTPAGPDRFAVVDAAWTALLWDARSADDTERVRSMKGGVRKESDRKLYPGYVFIQMRLYGEDNKLINKPWYFVKEVAGVIGFVGGDRPAALRQAEIDEIKARIEAASGKEVPKVSYEIGEEVKITDGAFANLTGRIDEIDPARGKLKISVSIFGRFTPVELEYWQVQRASES